MNPRANGGVGHRCNRVRPQAGNDHFSSRGDPGDRGLPPSGSPMQRDVRAMSTATLVHFTGSATMMRILIRQGEARDVEILVTFLQELFTLEKDFAADTENQRAGLLLLLSNPGEAAVFVAEADGAIVGMVTAQIVVSTSIGGYSILLEDMYVSSGFRRQGVGSKLLEQVLAWGSERGASRVQLVVATSNARAFRFYRQAGLLKSHVTAFYGKLDVMNPADS